MEEAKVEPADPGTVKARAPRRPTAAGAPRETRGLRLGHLAVSLLVFEAATGFGLLFHYRPAVDAAYLDLVDLREVSRFGFLRGLHRWGAWAAVLVVWLHLLQVAVRGSFAPPRRANWNAGVALMVLTLLLAVTGYLLPWDQDAYWGIATLSPAAGVDGSSLLAVYVLHGFALPLLVAGLTAFHLRRARRDAEAGRGPAG